MVSAGKPGGRLAWRRGVGGTEESEAEVDGWAAHVEELFAPRRARCVRTAAGGSGRRAGTSGGGRTWGRVTSSPVPDLRGADALRVRGRRNDAGRIAWGFRSLFNLPEVTTMLRRDAPQDAILAACARLLRRERSSGRDGRVSAHAAGVGRCRLPVPESSEQGRGKRAAQSLRLRTAAVGVDEISVDANGIHVTDRRMRARFAARFGTKQIDEGAGAVRADDVRSAFNSPFWPFVLCSTSVGQEGLDFHLYCHAVVHWNLPSNPSRSGAAGGPRPPVQGPRHSKERGSVVRRSRADVAVGGPVARGVRNG